MKSPIRRCEITLFLRVISPVYIFGVKVTPDLECLLAASRHTTKRVTFTLFYLQCRFCLGCSSYMYIQKKNKAKCVSASYTLSFVYTPWNIFMLLFGRDRWFCIGRACACIKYGTQCGENQHYFGRDTKLCFFSRSTK